MRASSGSWQKLPKKWCKNYILQFCSYTTYYNAIRGTEAWEDPYCPIRERLKFVGDAEKYNCKFELKNLNMNGIIGPCKHDILTLNRKCIKAKSAAQ